jgi:hypothetical protein
MRPHLDHSRSFDPWYDLDPVRRAERVFHYLPRSYGSPRARWRLVFAVERRRLKSLLRRLVRAGTVGSIFGVRILRSDELDR